jgi:MOSC domain-containing protein YiiM
MAGDTTQTMSTGHVEAIFLAQPAEGERVQVREVTAVAGHGLEGDAHFRGPGTRRRPDDKNGRDITLMEAEAIEGLAADTGIELEPWEGRRNVLTRGIGLNDLVGRRFRVGEVECVGRRLCDPCSHLESLTAPGVLRGLVDRGGLRADVVVGGSIGVGDDVADLGPADD